MAGEIARASERLDQRKQSIASASKEEPAVVTKDQALNLFGGFDLDPTELHQVEDFIGVHCVAMMAQGIAPLHAIASVFADGLAMGLLIAEERGKAGAS
jgi:hypothetical protein